MNVGVVFLFLFFFLGGGDVGCEQPYYFEIHGSIIIIETL